jgi:hypothetical protein
MFADYGQFDSPEARYSHHASRGLYPKSDKAIPILTISAHLLWNDRNLTMRMAMRRFTRLTNAFSKKLSHLRAAVALHFAYYNFCRVHSSLRVTPAMEAGLADHVWSIAELLGAA